MQEPHPTIRLNRIHCYDERGASTDPPPWLMSFSTGLHTEAPARREDAAAPGDDAASEPRTHPQAM